MDTSRVENYIRGRLSSVDIFPVNNHTDNQIPKSHELYSFFIKNETKFFNSNITTEEFNTTVGMTDPHMTIALNWTAAVVVNSAQRIAHGQHFVQLRHLYENIYCPETNLYNTKAGAVQTMKIYELTLKDTSKYERRRDRIFDDGDDDEDNWEPNNNYVGKRCLLEDELFAVSGKV